ncbi:MAG: metallophosphoesterase [Bacteroidales bacterium]|nr:metallophosphoesterase [Bacteroidales bacterium]
MNRIITLFTAMAAMALVSCTPKTTGTDSVNSVKFNADGKFKIAQLTDTHLSWTEPDEYEKTYNQLCSILDNEKPDLVILTGDVVTGDGGGAEALDKFFSAIDDRKIPYIAVYGNHDRERDLSEWDLAEAFCKHPMSLNTMSGSYLDDVALPVMSSDGSKVAAVLYCIDSNDYTQVPEYYEYAWISHSQIEWYNNQSRAFAKANGNIPVPSYAFFHIPLIEFNHAYNLNCESGVRMEDECPGELNSGIFSAFVGNQDVHGVFCGHDHDNDYIASEGNVALVYGRFSGDHTTYTHLEKGIRIIELSEGDFGFHTWIRQRDLSAVADETFDPAIDYTLREAVPAEGKKHGLTRTRYDNVPSIEVMEEQGVKGATDVVAYPRSWGNLGTPNYGYTYDGYLSVPESGIWNICVQADNQIAVDIDDYSFTDQPGRSGWGKVRVNLEKGYHHVHIKLMSYSDNCYMKFMWYLQGEGDRYHEITPDYWYLK